MNYFTGDVDHGDTVTDYMEEERNRGITINSAVVTYHWNKHRVNLIDTPGIISQCYSILIGLFRGQKYSIVTNIICIEVIITVTAVLIKGHLFDYRYICGRFYMYGSYFESLTF